jgi:hypothetical protein
VSLKKWQSALYLNLEVQYSYIVRRPGLVVDKELWYWQVMQPHRMKVR